MAFRGTTAFSTIKQLYNIFNERQKRVFKWLVFLTFISSLTDLLGLSMIIPVVGLVLSDKFYNSLIHAVPALSHVTKQQMLLSSAGIFFVLIILKNLFGLYINWLQVKFVRNFFLSSSMNVLNKVYERPLLDIQKDTSNEIVNKLTTLQINLSSNAAISTLIIINEAMVFSLTAIIICIANWQLFLLLIGVLAPTMGLFYSRVKGMIKTAGLKKSQENIKLYARAQEMIYGYIDIKIAGTQKSFKKQFEQSAKEYSIQQTKIDFMMFIPTRIIEIAIFLCIVVILLYGVYVIKDTEKIITTITLFSVIAYRSIPSVNRFVMGINNLNATEFIFKDPDFTPVIHHEYDGTGRDLQLNKGIIFDHVSYKYPGSSKYVVKDCNIEIKRGEKIGFIGKSGAGKSTLVSNILGFLLPTEGSIYIDSTPLKEDNIKDWWRIVGYVRQEVFMMNATLLENIAIGETPEQVDMERLNKAISLASLSDLVADMPAGVNSMINERGNNLSGGQKQRISIARAIYKGAQILIFDEATSALDSHTEEEITNSIRKLGDENLTIIIIAHRYSSLKYCDKIYALEDGMIKNSYKYDELMLQTESIK